MNVVNANSSGKNHRWYVLTLAALTFTFTAAMQQICMPVLFKEIAEDLGMSLVEVGIVWGIPSFAGVLVVFLAGLLTDRFGAKRVMALACIMSGLFGALRGIAVDFTSLALISFLFGITFWVIPSSVYKTTATWFSGEKMVIANGVVSAGMGLGLAVGSMISATILSPLLGGWGNVLFLYGGISVVIGLLWLLTVKEHGQQHLGVSWTRIPLRQSISHVFPIKSIWLLGLTLLGYSGCINGMVGYLPTYLRDIGWTAASADGNLAIFSVLSTLGAIPLTLLSARIGLRKAILFPILLITIVGIALLPVLGSAMVWVIMIIIGISRDGFMAVALTISTETEGVGVVYAGTAMGLTQTLMNIGPVISPPLGNGLADPANPASPYPFFIWAAFGLLALVAFYFVKETGWRNKLQL